MQIIFLKASQREGEWAKSAWEAVASVPGERRRIESPTDVESVSLWRVGCVVGILDASEPERMTTFIRAVRTRDGGPDVPIIVCGAFESPERGLQWAHANGADDFLSTAEPASRLLRRVETFAGVSGDPPPIDRSLQHRKVIRSLREASERNRTGAAPEPTNGVQRDLPPQPPIAVVVSKNVISLPRVEFVAAPRPNGFGAGPAAASASATASAPAPAPAPASATAPATASAPASAPVRASSPLFSPAAKPQDDHAVWLKDRLVEIRESDYFTILRVARDASDDDVRAAFDAASRECSNAARALGDALAGPLAEVRAGLDEAYEVLANATLRSSYRAGLES
ncbi:MAG: hypothetical protein HYY84_18495 [Deltaproteobacteria bacterium]|nr:hypothetical protein [Deltaproteobacteria bacterium]